MDAKLYAAGFKQLADETERFWEQAKKDVDVFQEQIKQKHWRQHPLMRRKRLANVLRELLGIPGRRLVDVKKQSAKAQRADEADIKELLKNPHRAAQLQASQIGSKLAERVAEKPGLLTIAAFEDECILSPIELFRELKTYQIRCPTSPSGAVVWSEIVIRCLRNEDPGEKFLHINSDDPWAPVEISITACKMLAEQLEAVGQRGKPTEDQVNTVLTRLGLNGDEYKPCDYPEFVKRHVGPGNLRTAKNKGQVSVKSKTRDCDRNQYLVRDVVRCFYPNFILDEGK